MMRSRLISALAFSAAALPAAAASGRVAITPAQIAAAIRGQGLSVSAQQVTLLSKVVASTDAPILQVQSIEPWGDHRMRVRLECADPAQCLPFFVAVQGDQNSAVQPVRAGSWAAMSHAKPDSHAYVVRAGSPATLLIDGGHVHIRLAVICLENGAVGQTIQVASKDPRKTYLGQVVDGSVLRGSL